MQEFKIRVLGMDPGKVNFGWAVTDHWVSPDLRMRSEVASSGTVPEPPSGLLGDWASEFAPAADFLGGLIDDHGATLAAVERFTASGLRVGTTIEIANILSGAVLAKCREDGLRMLGSASVTWKGHFNRALADKEALRDVYRACAATPHQIDAALIGCWAASLELACDPFESVSGGADLESFLESLEATSLVRLRNVRL